MARLRKKGRGFTLIELIAVLVIMAIIALIVTPLVMNIIRKARISADKRSIDAYGRSIELAVASYLLDNGYFPTDVSQLTIEYSGNRVECTTTQLNNDSSVYLTGCTVDGRSVEYAYGENKTPEPVTPTYTAYSIGDHVSYNGVTYYVIEDSDTTNDTVKLLKENPLTKAEIDNLNLSDISSWDDNGYGVMEYSEDVDIVDYAQSDVKQVVDAWKTSVVKPGDTATARLIKIEELTDNLGYVIKEDDYHDCALLNENVPTWLYSNNYEYGYWTMSSWSDEDYTRYDVWTVYYIGDLVVYGSWDYGRPAVRPVLELSKSADITIVN